MKPNCLFSRLDRLNYQNGYYRVQMGLTEDILESESLFGRRFDRPLEISRSDIGRSTPLGWVRLTERIASLALNGRAISNWVFNPNCPSNIPLGWSHGSLGSKYPSNDWQNRQEPWQTYLTFSYLNV